MSVIRTEFGFVDEDAMEELWDEYEPQDLWAASDTLKNLMAGDFAGPDVNKLLGNLDALTNMLLRLRGNHSIPRPRDQRPRHPRARDGSLGPGPGICRSRRDH